MLFETWTGPHESDDTTFQTSIAVLPPPLTGVVFRILFESTTTFTPDVIPMPHCPVLSRELLRNCPLRTPVSAIIPQPDALCPPVTKLPCTTMPLVFGP